MKEPVIIHLENTTLEQQLRALIQDNYDLKLQHANDAEEISQMRQQITSLRQPQQL